MTDSATSLRTVRAAGIAGLAFAVLITTAFILFRANPPTNGQIPPGGRDLWLIGLYLIPFAGIGFLWFLAVLRRRIGRLEDQFFATVFLASGLLFVAMLFASTAAATATVAAGQLGTDAASQAVFRFGEALADALFYVFTVKMAAVFMLVSSTIGRRTGSLPGWLVVVGAVSGIVMLLSVGFFELLAVIFPAWVAVVAVLLLRADPAAWDSD